MKSGRDSGEYGERIMQMEAVGKSSIGLSFQGFFDPALKDLIKSIDDSHYDIERKIWIIPA